MLFMHEVHKVRGRAEDEFEATFRDGWMPMLGDRRRRPVALVHQPRARQRPRIHGRHGDRRSRRTAWERLALRIQKGDLRTGCAISTSSATTSTPNCLCRLPWSPLKDVDFDDVPTDGREHELTLYMEDTMWPYEDKFARVHRPSGEVYAKSLDRPQPAADHRGRVPAGARQPPAPRGRADAAHPRPEAHCSDCSRPRFRPSIRAPGHVDARRARVARPMGQPAAADLLLVTPVLSRA